MRLILINIKTALINQVCMCVCGDFPSLFIYFMKECNFLTRIAFELQLVFLLFTVYCLLAERQRAFSLMDTAKKDMYTLL